MRRNLATKTSWRKKSFDIEKLSHHISEQTLCKLKLALIWQVSHKSSGEELSCQRALSDLVGIKKMVLVPFRVLRVNLSTIACSYCFIFCCITVVVVVVLPVIATGRKGRKTTVFTAFRKTYYNAFVSFHKQNFAN